MHLKFGLGRWGARASWRGAAANVLHRRDCFRLLLDVGRICIRDFDFFLAELFAGHHGSAELGSMRKVYVKHIECRDAHHRGAFDLSPEMQEHGGMTLKEFLWRFWAHGVLPEALKNK